jgi:hypothetical protein
MARALIGCRRLALTNECHEARLDVFCDVFGLFWSIVVRLTSVFENSNVELSKRRKMARNS